MSSTPIPTKKPTPSAKAAGLGSEAELTRQILLSILAKKEMGALDDDAVEKAFVTSQIIAKKLLAIN